MLYGYISLWSDGFTIQDSIFRVVAAILHLGNINFTKGKEVDSSMPKDDKSHFHLEMAAELLMYASISEITFLFIANAAII